MTARVAKPSFAMKCIWGLSNVIGVYSPGFYCMVFTTFDFLNRLCKCTVGGFGGAGGFVIYDETATNNENKANKENDAEDKENM